LFSTLVWRGDLIWEWQMAKRTALLLVSTAIMAGALIYAMPYTASWLAPGAHLLSQVAALGVLIGIAMVVYFGVAFLIGGADLGMIRRNIKRKSKTPA